MKDESVALFERSVAYLDSNNFVKAIDELTKLLELQPDNPSGLLHRGYAYKMNHNSDLAIIDFTASIKLHPTNPDAFFHRGCLYSAAGQYNAAIVDITRSVNQDAENQNPVNQDAYLQLGIAYLHLKQYPAAIINLTHLIKLNSSNSAAYFYMGYVYAKTGDYQEAIKNFSISIRKRRHDKNGPCDPNAYALLNQAYNCELAKTISSAGICSPIRTSDNASSSSSLSSTPPLEASEVAHVSGLPASAEFSFVEKAAECKSGPAQEL